MSRCDVCSCKSEAVRELAYGGVIKEPDGTFSDLCRECFDEFLPLSAEERKKRWPVIKMTIARALGGDPWADDVRNYSRHTAATISSVCMPGCEIVDRYNPTAAPTVSFDTGRDAFYQKCVERGDLHRDELSYRASLNTETGAWSWSKHPPGLEHCAQCGTVERDSGAYQVCSRCKSTYYCSVACQRYAWPKHKRTCQSAPAEE